MNKRTMTGFVAVFLLISTCPTAWGQLGGIGELPSLSQDDAFKQIEVIPQYAAVAGGLNESCWVAVKVTLNKGWKWYGPAPGKAALKEGVTPAGVNVQLDGRPMVPQEVRWSKQTLIPGDAATGFPATWGYSKNLTLFFRVKPPIVLGAARHTIRVGLTGLTCSQSSCVPISENQATAKVTISTLEVKKNPAWEQYAPLLEKAKTAEQWAASVDNASASAATPVAASARPGGDLGFGLALGLALLAGLILNIMPCVLPVLPIRILSVVEMASGSRRKYVTLGLAYALGMLGFFGAIAAVNVILKLTVGRGVDLNMLFAEPVGLIVMAMVVLALAANLLGVFDVIVPSKVAALDGRVQGEKTGHLRSAGMGFMTGVLATPCSFAFLAAALGYAQTAPLALGTIVILVIGVGMAAPHALLAAFPSLIKFLPKPGVWMERLRQGAGMLLLFVVIYLLASLQGEGGWAFRVGAWGVILVWGLWMWSKWVRYDAPRIKKFIVRLAAAALVVGTGFWLLPEPKAPLLESQPFDEAMIQSEVQAGKTVLVKFTADWCAKCKIQESEIFEKPQLAKAVKELGVVYVKADATRSDNPAAIWMQNNGFGRNLPLVLVYSPKKTYGPYYGNLTLDQLIDVLTQAAGQKTK